MYLRKTTSRGKEYYQVCEVVNGKVKVLQHLGSLPSIIKTFQYVKDLEDTVSTLKQQLSQYVTAINQTYNEVAQRTEK